MTSRSVFYTTLGVASSTGSIADLNDLDDELSKILIRDVIRGDKPISTQDDMNRTALFYSGFEETQKLLKLGINPFLKDVNGKKAHEYTRDPDSRDFIVKALNKFEESVRDKTIPLMTQFRQFFKKYIETTYDIVFPDVVL